MSTFLIIVLSFIIGYYIIPKFICPLLGINEISFVDFVLDDNSFRLSLIRAEFQSGRERSLFCVDMSDKTYVDLLWIRLITLSA